MVRAISKIRHIRKGEILVSELRNFTTEQLISELENRNGVRSTHIREGEFSKIEAKGIDESKLRYLKGYGPGVIITTTRNNSS